MGAGIFARSKNLPIQNRVTMLSISSKSKYGIQAVLTLAENHGQGLMQVKDIARLNNISVQYLVQIFSLLVKAEIISSVRGKNGGYRLSRAPEKITALDILTILDGEIEFSEKQEGSGDVVDDLLKAAEVRLREVFTVSLAELLLRQEKMNHILMYDI